ETNIRIWLGEFTMGDADQQGSPSLEGFPAICHGENNFGGQFYPPSIMRPTSKGNGDFLILTNPNMGWIKYDIKSERVFFTPSENIAMDEVKDMVKELRKKNLLLIIDGSLQPVSKVHELREYLSKSPDPQIREIPVVHPEESNFEGTLDKFWNLPENVENSRIVEEKAEFLAEKTINSGENIDNFLSITRSPNSITNDTENATFHRGNEIADNYLGRLPERFTNSPLDDIMD